VHKSIRANEEKYRISNIEYRKTKCRPFRPLVGVGISITHAQGFASPFDSLRSLRAEGLPWAAFFRPFGADIEALRVDVNNPGQPCSGWLRPDEWPGLNSLDSCAPREDKLRRNDRGAAGAEEEPAQRSRL